MLGGHSVSSRACLFMSSSSKLLLRSLYPTVTGWAGGGDDADARPRLPTCGTQRNQSNVQSAITGSVLAAQGKRQKKLSTMQVDPSLISWMTDYLTDRPQFVRIGSSISSSTTSSTGAPHCTLFSVSTVQAVFVNKDLFCITCLTK